MLQFISFHFNRCKEYDNDEHTTTPPSSVPSLEKEERGRKDNHTYVGIGTLFCHLSSLRRRITHDDEIITHVDDDQASFLIHLLPSPR